MIKGNGFAQIYHRFERYYAGNLEEKTRAIIKGTHFFFDE